MARRGGNRQTQPFTGEDLDALFWAQVDTSGECWTWLGNRNDRGYGSVTRRGQAHRAHRVAWELAHGRPVPPGLLICHTCDNPSCVNPAHLYAGTHEDNMRDKTARGRCSRLGKRRFSDADIRAVVELVGLGWMQRDAASLFGMDPSHLSRLVRGESGRVGGVRP